MSLYYMEKCRKGLMVYAENIENYDSLWLNLSNTSTYILSQI